MSTEVENNARATGVGSADLPALRDVTEGGRFRGPRVHIIDSAAIDRETAYDLAGRLRRDSVEGYSLLLLDGWRTFIDQDHPVRLLENGPLAPGERIAASTFSSQQLTQYMLWAAGLTLPLLFGVSNAMNNPISPATLAVEAVLREHADRRVLLYRSELFCGTDEWRRQQRCVVPLTGDSPGGRNY